MSGARGGASPHLTFWRQVLLLLEARQAAEAAYLRKVASVAVRGALEGIELDSLAQALNSSAELAAPMAAPAVVAAAATGAAVAATPSVAQLEVKPKANAKGKVQAKGERGRENLPTKRAPSPVTFAPGTHPGTALTAAPVSRVAAHVAAPAAVPLASGAEQSHYLKNLASFWSTHADTDFGAGSGSGNSKGGGRGTGVRKFQPLPAAADQTDDGAEGEPAPILARMSKREQVLLRSDSRQYHYC